MNTADMEKYREYVRSLMPKRYADSHKGAYGKALLICGSDKYRGAALLACEGCIRCGAGITALASEGGVRDIVLKTFPEVICTDIVRLYSSCRNDSIAEHIGGYSAYLVGCGCGISDSLKELLYEILHLPGPPIVIDADGINSLAMNRDYSLSVLSSSKREVLITPHPLEFSRISGFEMQMINNDREGCARTFAEKYSINVLLKGHNSVICSPKGKTAINPSGSSALSKGGSGDVLAGAVTSFIAQGADVFDAAVVSAYLHGMAGESLAKEFSEYGVLASELPKQMAREICTLLR
ncbi:MAG: NAD(P)H-hydrate dehydratase [Eubacteriales bacterium]|nr:NAD(P)H-hydrate dehydratase [Eubacteriales bacterium]